jgi:hypothetical protein
MTVENLAPGQANHPDQPGRPPLELIVCAPSSVNERSAYIENLIPTSLDEAVAVEAVAVNVVGAWHAVPLPV